MGVGVTIATQIECDKLKRAPLFFVDILLLKWNIQATFSIDPKAIRLASGLLGRLQNKNKERP